MVQAETDTAWSRLHRFLTREMRMSHVYQPVMIKTLLVHGNKASTREVAEAIVAALFADQSQLCYYEERTINMVGPVLAGHGIAMYDAQRNEFSLTLPSIHLTASQRTSLIRICEEKQNEFAERRGLPRS